MAGFDVLDPRLPLYQDYFIEASAGTGKTFAIENIVTRLLSDPDGPEIDQILVVTFTRAATVELKRRIYANIEKAIDGVEGVSKKRLKMALATFDEAKIFTIHSFCFHALQEHALDVGLSLDQIEESAPVGMVETIVKDFLRTADIHPRQLDLLLKKDFDQLLTKLVHITQERLPIVGGKSYEELLRSFNLEIAHWDDLSKEAILEELLALSSSFRGFCDRKKMIKPEAKVRLRRFVFSRGDEIDPILLQFAPNNLLKRATLPSSGILEHLQNRLLPIVKQANDEWILLADLAERGRKRAERVIQEEELLFYEDLLQLMAKNVADPSFAENIRGEYRAVLIDEFQDTDPLQWKIFSTLFANDLFSGPLYLVGDPKQSIYRFRGADIYTYLAAKDQFEKEHWKTLDRNYRSAPALVGALNKLFLATSDFMELPRVEKTLNYTAVQADPKKPAGEGELICWQAPDEEDFFPAITSEIRRLHQQENIPYSGYAVLVKDRYQADRFFGYAQKVNLPVISRRSYSLVDSEAYPILIELFTALVDPKDSSALAKLLGGALFRWSYERIACEKESWIPQFYQLSQTLKERGILVAFEELMAQSDLLASQGGETLYSDLLQLVEVMASEVQSIEHYLPFLKALANEKESDKLKARQIGDENAAQILTIHASKGLEFEVVFPIGLMLSSSHRKQLLPDSQRTSLTTEEDPLHEEESNAEKMRQFYVATTRAKKYLYLTILEEKNSTSPMALFLQKQKKPLNITPLPEVFPEIPPKKRDLAPPPKIEITFSPLAIHSFTSLAHPHAEKKAIPKGHSFPTGAETGILLHKLFEELPFEKAFSSASLAPLVAPILQKTALEPWTDQISEMVYNAFHTPLPAKDGSFPLASVDPSKIFKEMEFLYSSDSPPGHIKGFIDLCFVRGDKYYLLDWKSNWLENYTAPYLEREMEENDYHLQLKLYQRALEQYFGLFDTPYTFGGAYYIFLRGLPDGIYRYPLC